MATKLIEVQFKKPAYGSYTYKIRERMGVLDKTYTYTAPEDAGIEVGDEVIVPVQTGSREHRGIATVVAVSDLDYKQVIGKVALI